MQNKEAFEAALLRVEPLLTELSDDFIVAVIDRTGDVPQSVVFLHGDPDCSKMLALAVQYQAEKLKDEDSDPGFG